MRRDSDKEEIGNYLFFIPFEAHHYQSRCAFFIQLEFNFFQPFAQIPTLLVECFFAIRHFLANFPSWNKTASKISNRFWKKSFFSFRRISKNWKMNFPEQEQSILQAYQLRQFYLLSQLLSALFFRHHQNWKQ